MALFVLLAAAAPAAARSTRPRRSAATVDLDGRRTAVRWVDGDTFRVLEGPHRGENARLEGYNTLESYGPVHRWGAWRGEELLALAHAATLFAASRHWSCTTRGELDRYRRPLVACPALAAALVERGLAMVFAVGRPADGELLALQREARRRGEGMWREGAPRHLVSSVHSADENGAGGAYDRVVDTDTGQAEARPHAGAYGTCQEVCYGERGRRRHPGGDGSCMRYVPFERRYRHRPWCLLQHGWGRR